MLTITDQISEYQSECEEYIIMGKSIKEKEKQIKLLINEVKAIRRKIINIITFNKRIFNFDEFINCVDIIQQLKNSGLNEKIEKLKLRLKKLIF